MYVPSTLMQCAKKIVPHIHSGQGDFADRLMNSVLKTFYKEIQIIVHVRTCCKRKNFNWWLVRMTKQEPIKEQALHVSVQ